MMDLEMERTQINANNLAFDLLFSARRGISGEE